MSLSPLFTTRHYNVITALIADLDTNAQLSDGQFGEVLATFISWLSTDNARFDDKVFTATVNALTGRGE